MVLLMLNGAHRWWMMSIDGWWCLWMVTGWYWCWMMPVSTFDKTVHAGWSRVNSASGVGIFVVLLLHAPILTFQANFITDFEVSSPFIFIYHSELFRNVLSQTGKVNNPEENNHRFGCSLDCEQSLLFPPVIVYRAWKRRPRGQRDER